MHGLNVCRFRTNTLQWQLAAESEAKIMTENLACLVISNAFHVVKIASLEGDILSQQAVGGSCLVWDCINSSNHLVSVYISSPSANPNSQCTHVTEKCQVPKTQMLRVLQLVPIKSIAKLVDLDMVKQNKLGTNNSCHAHDQPSQHKLIVLECKVW